MPKLRRKSVHQRKVASRSLMRSQRAATDDPVDDDDGPGCSVVDPVGSVSDEGHIDPADQQWSVLSTATAVGTSDLGTLKQTEVYARLSEPSGPSVTGFCIGTCTGTCIGNCTGLCIGNHMEILNDMHKMSRKVLESDLHCTDIPTNDDRSHHLTCHITNTDILDNIQIGNARECETINGQQSTDKIHMHMPTLGQAKMMFLNATGKPFNAVSLTLGTFHQGDYRFNAESRGSQCTANALCSLIYAQYSHITFSKTLDNILDDGDCLYQKVVMELKAKGVFKSKLLNFDEMPLSVTLLGKEVAVLKSDIITGVCTQQFADSCLPALHQSLNTAFKKSSNMLLLIGSICSAIFKKRSEYFIFDSHSHGLDGLADEDGKSLLASFSCMDDLISFLYAMYDSMFIDIRSQFEILPVHFEIADDNHDKESLSKSLCNTASDSECKTVGHMKNRKHSENDITKTLIDKYFEDQKEKQGLHELKNASGCGRKRYFQKYKQEKRLSAVYRQKEKIAKQNARKSIVFKQREVLYQTKSKGKSRISTDFKEKEIQYQKVSKQSLRKSSTFKQKELEKKRESRERHEFKNKELQYQKTSKQNLRKSSTFKQKELEKKRESRERHEFKNKELQYQKTSKQNLRKSSTFKQKELEKKRESRERHEFKNKELQYQKASKQNLRKSSTFKRNELEKKRESRERHEFKNKELQYQKTSKQNLRKSSTFKQKELEKKRESRERHEFKHKELQYQKTSKQNLRKSSTFKRNELEKKRESRERHEFKHKEMQYQKSSKQKLRKNSAFIVKEMQYQKSSKQRARKSTEFKQTELDMKRKYRQCDQLKEKEIEYQRKSKQRARKIPLRMETERILKQQWRSDNRNKQTEKKSDCNRKTEIRKDQAHCDNEQLSAKRKKFGSDVFSSIEKFHEKVSVGPTYVCSCCHQTWFRQSVSEARSLSTEQREKFLSAILSVSNKEWICATCKSNIVENKVPKLSVLNGMGWPEKPLELKLFPLEERLISLRIPFMQIRELPKGRQYSVKGNVVNVPTDIQPVVNALPRPLDDNVVVAVKLKKKMSYSSSVYTENIRPIQVLVALHWLMRHSQLYKNAGVNVDDDWVRRVTQNCSEELVKEFVASNNCNSEKCAQPTDTEVYDSDDENSGQENVGNLDTLVDYSDLENRTNMFTFAPGENQKPLSIYQDLDSEYLCFPTIFCGQRRPENAERTVPVHYSDIVKWELRSSDRRAANSVPNIFFKLKKIQMKQLNDKVNLAIRQCQLNGKSLTAEKVWDASYTEEFVRKDHGYYIFKQLRNSPAYLETKKKDVFAMIRQLGLPTWFMSLSSADTRWTDLLRMLLTLNCQSKYSDEDIAKMSWEEKTKLVQKDPVTCSRYFDHRVQEFMKIFLGSEHAPIGSVKDYFYRVEFQQRGSPHIHMIVWIDDSPKVNDSPVEEIVQFVDRYLTCSSEQPLLQDLVQLQTHKHSRTCRKKEDTVCRFGYPLPPLPKTMVLYPLDSDIDKYRKLYQALQKKINSEKEGFNMTYEDFLVNIVQLSEEEYIKCIRSSLRAAKVFLKRSPKDIRVNYYNESVLQAWKANMDMQFVLDPYACAMYIVSYISKSQRGMSTLMHAACKEAKQGNLDIKRQVRHVGNIFSNSVEVSAQEAVYLVLQMPLTRCTRDVSFINTSPPNKRVHLLKTSTALEELPDHSTDVFADNTIKRYAKRPKCLENYCLADYVSELQIVYPKDERVNNHDDVNDDDLYEDDQLEFDDEATVLKLKNGIVIRKRKNKRVIRYVRFNRRTDEKNHYREKLLLFYPWRGDENEMLGQYESYKDRYDTVKHFVDAKVKQYEHNAEQLDEAIDMAEQDENTFDTLAPGAQEEEASIEQEQPLESDTFVYFNPAQVAHREYDIGIEIGTGCTTAAIEPQDNMLSEDDYCLLLRSLNSKQKHFYNHVIHWLKEKDEPIYAFLSGGAGVGKSVVIRALYQTLYRMLNCQEGENPDDIRVLLCAFTGKAAYNINGSTISSAFMEKFKQANQSLGCDQLNTFRSKYRNLSVIIIDEISMVSNRKLSFIDQRLQALTGTTLPFGGKSIIAVGDLYQLKPVADSWIFEDLSKDVSALSPNLWKNHFTMFELTEIMRQKDDLNFAEILNRLRHNKMTERDKQQIASCLIDPDAEHYPKMAPHIFAENYFMDKFNEKMIMTLDAEKVTIKCHDSIAGGNLSAEKQKCILSKISTESSRTMGLHHSLTVVVGMIYDLTINLDTEDGLNNGSPCVVQSVEYKQAETTRPSIIWVKFDDAKAGKKRRQLYQKRGFYHDGIDLTWTPVFDVERSFPYNKLNIQRIQFPLQPSAGRSVYRAQGTTLDSLVIDLTQRKTRKIPHLHYVALSRVKSIQNLHIVNFNEKALQLDEKVVQEMIRLHESANMTLCYVPLDTIDSNAFFKIAFNNCRSLHKHIQDVKADQNVLSAHVVAFAESRLCSRDVDSDYLIQGYRLLRNDQSSDGPSLRPPHGLAVYVKNNIEIVSCTRVNETQLEFIFIHVRKDAYDKQIVFLYKAPSMSFSHMKTACEKTLCNVLDKSKDIIILGDFNIDMAHQNNTLCAWVQKKFGCKQLVNGVTTNYGTTLDLIFTNCEGLSGIVETYWSDHKIIYFASSV